MRIALATDTYYPSVTGVSYFSQRLARYLGKKGHQVLVIAPSLNARSECSTDNNNVKVFGVRSVPVVLYKGFRWCLWAPQGPVARGIEEFQPDVIHLQTHFALGRAALRAGRKFGIPVMGTHHFMPENLVDHLRLIPPLRGVAKKLYWQHFTYVYGKLDLVTAPSQAAFEQARTIGFSKIGEVVSNGVDLDHFNPSYKNSPGIPLPPGPKLLFVGRLDKEKNLDIAIRAFARVAERTQSSFVIAGPGTQAEKLKRLAGELGVSGRVVFTGFVPDLDLPALYGAVNAFIMPGTAELQSIAAMEAMATGLPVIAADAMALPALVDDGGSGYLFRPGDIDRLASCMLNVISDEPLAQKMGQASLEKIQTHDLNLVVSKFESLYMKLAGETPPIRFEYGSPLKKI